MRMELAYESGSVCVAACSSVLFQMGQGSGEIQHKKKGGHF